jgi:hypothetical protein
MRHNPSYKQLEVKTKRTSLLWGNRNGHHNTELILDTRINNSCYSFKSFSKTILELHQIKYQMIFYSTNIPMSYIFKKCKHNGTTKHKNKSLPHWNQVFLFNHTEIRCSCLPHWNQVFLSQVMSHVVKS